MITELRKEFLIDRQDPCYPPHHKGDHLEEAFIKFWQLNGIGDRKLIPIHWTAVYNYKAKEGFGEGTPNGQLRNKLQSYLDSLDRHGKYFIVCTHDDAPKEILPPDTQVFAAGGNSNRIDVPIPLTCGPHQEIYDQIRTIPCSFVGSITHKIRYDLINFVHGKPGFAIGASEWKETVSKESADSFKRVALSSVFTLCPRGYGATSYRLYEAIQLGTIPVYVSDKHLLPWSDELDWNRFCIILNQNEIPLVQERTLGMKGKEIRKIQESLDGLWDKHFSIESTCKHILKRVRS